MFNCRKNTQLVSENLDRELSLHQRMSMTLHGLMCGACRAYRRQIEAIDALIKQHYQQPTGPHNTQPPTDDGQSGNEQPGDAADSKKSSPTPHGLSQTTRLKLKQLIASAIARHKQK